MCFSKFEEDTSTTRRRTARRIETARIILAEAKRQGRIAEYVNQPINDAGETAILYAFNSLIAWREALDLLLEAGANINAMSKQGTILHKAAQLGSIEKYQYLVQRGADTTIRNPDGKTAEAIMVATL